VQHDDVGVLARELERQPRADRDGADAGQGGDAPHFDGAPALLDGGRPRVGDEHAVPDMLGGTLAQERQDRLHPTFDRRIELPEVKNLHDARSAASGRR
jgi:hypothetical protein